ncbi:YybH family protein [Daejeonella oryzae]|uniref:YybH family protein n=1 Tax=Daejeonella oryzae TaxID=1122943 RepID=UPI000425D25C|nr:nuclear transport factor 2 family protein [Daejeonella oryzae]
MTILTTQAFSQDKSISEVKTALEGQISAWNKGNLEGAMSFYWNSDKLLWISKSGTDKGYQPVFESFLSDFKDRSQMGKFTYEPLHIESLSDEIVYYVYRWKIELGDKKLMGGISSQIWRKPDNKWVITSEHAS